VEPPRERISEGKKDKNFIFVVFLGGITYAEIQGIRFLNLKHKEYKFIILTTEVISSKKFFAGLDPDFGSPFKMKDYYEEIRKEESNKRSKK
jgi:molybdate-binding protein